MLIKSGRCPQILVLANMLISTRIKLSHNPLILRIIYIYIYIIHALKSYFHLVPIFLLYFGNLPKKIYVSLEEVSIGYF
jgi:hypothetical protein